MGSKVAGGGGSVPKPDFSAECLPSEDFLEQGWSLGLWQAGVCTSFFHPMERFRATGGSMGRGLSRGGKCWPQEGLP